MREDNLAYTTEDMWLRQMPASWSSQRADEADNPWVERRTAGNRKKAWRYVFWVRPPLEAIGVDISMTAKDILGLEIKWSQGNLIPEYLTLVCGIFYDKRKWHWTTYFIKPAGQMPPFSERFFSSKKSELFAILTKQKKVNDVHLLRRERLSNLWFLRIS